MELKDLVSEESILEAFKKREFSNDTEYCRSIIRKALLIVTCGHEITHTAKCILQELNLIGNPKYKTPTLTKKGKQYLFMCYENK